MVMMVKLLSGDMSHVPANHPTVPFPAQQDLLMLMMVYHPITVKLTIEDLFHHADIYGYITHPGTILFSHPSAAVRTVTHSFLDDLR
jgi:hypothetical protein